MVATSWVLSPLVGGIIAFIMFKIIAYFILATKEPVKSAKKAGPAFIGLTIFIIFLSIFYYDVKPHLWLIILGIIVTMIVTEFGDWKKKGYALVVFVLSGYLGMLAFNNEPLMAPLFSCPSNLSSPLVPLLGGLFGASTLMASLLTGCSSIPPQRFDVPHPRISTVKNGIVTGTLAGAFVSWIPGLSPSIGTILAYLVTSRKGLVNRARDYIVAISGVNTSDAIFSLLTLWVIERARSGTLIVIDELVPPADWTSTTLMTMMAVVVLSSIGGYFITIKVGRLLSHALSEIDMRILSSSVILLLASISFIFGGVFGLSLFLCAIPIGLLTIFSGIRRSNAMGVILLPILVNQI